MVRFSEDFIWYGKEFQTFGPRYLKLFVPNLTWFDFGISRFSLYFSRVGRFVILSLKMSFIKLGLMSLRVLKISIHKLDSWKHSRCFFLIFLIILRTNYCSHYVKNQALAFADFQLYLKPSCWHRPNKGKEIKIWWSETIFQNLSFLKTQETSKSHKSIKLLGSRFTYVTDMQVEAKLVISVYS